MTIDKPQHQQFLLELLKQANYPGHLLDLAYEVKCALLEAKVEQENEPV